MHSLAEFSALSEGPTVDTNIQFSSVSIDSRSLKPGALFVAIKGDRFDGHDFIAAAKQQGAVAALVEKPVNVDLPWVQVACTQQALSHLAQTHRSRFSLPVIALTGSCGKTTTKEMLRSILGQCGQVLAPPKSFNTVVGMALTLLALRLTHRFVVLEMGANTPGEIAYLTQIAQPTVAMILNVNPAHLAGFGSLSGIAQAKAEIFQGLGTEGLAIINADDAFSAYWRDQLGNRAYRSFSTQQTADCFAQEVTLDATGKPQFTLTSSQGNQTIQLPLLGRHQVNNALAAATAALNVGVSLSDIKAGLETVQAVPGRLTALQGLQGATLLDDSYNANPGSLQVALAVLSQYPGQRLLVLGDMAELGSASADYHRQMGEWAKQQGIHQLYTCGTLAQFATLGFGKQAWHFDTQAALIAALKVQLQPDCTVLIKGSRSAAMEQVVIALQ